MDATRDAGGLSHPDGEQVLRVVVAIPNGPDARPLAEDLSASGLVVCAVEHGAERAIEAAFAHRPDVFLVAAELPGSAVIAVAAVAGRMPRTKVVVLADCPDDDDCLTYVLAGASGYLPTGTGAMALASALRSVVAGSAILPPTAQRRLIEELRA
jgi:DNA-binding NarL/FixJ family response regulator